MGYILDGKYHKGSPDMSKMGFRIQGGYRQHEQNRQRKDFAKEIIQPYDRNGKPNEDFLQAYPEESKEYGFTPNDKDLRKD